MQQSAMGTPGPKCAGAVNSSPRRWRKTVIIGTAIGKSTTAPKGCSTVLIRAQSYASEAETNAVVNKKPTT
jgi:hypothetical protein